MLLNGAEAPVESGQSPEVRIVRLPPSAGQASKVVIEVSYSLSGVKASGLQAPSLPGDVPVQQTLWRIWLPEENAVLAFDRTFARLSSRRAKDMLHNIARNQPTQITFKLPAEGQSLNFIRQGAAGTLSISTIRRELLACLVWVVIIVVGVAMLKLEGFSRCVIILAALLASAVAGLFSPLFVRQILRFGWPAGVLVLLLWGAHWFFKRRKQRQQASPSAAELVTDEPSQTSLEEEKKQSDKTGREE